MPVDEVGTNYRPTLVTASLLTPVVNSKPETVDAGAQPVLDENGLALLDSKGRVIYGAS